MRIEGNKFTGTEKLWQSNMLNIKTKESNPEKNLINRIITSKQDILELSKKSEFKTQVEELMLSSKTEATDGEKITEFFLKADSNYSKLEEILQKGVNLAKILNDSNSTDEEKNSARIQIRDIYHIVDILGKLTRHTYDACNSVTSGKLGDIIGKISNGFIQNGILNEDFSVNSLLDFSSKSLKLGSTSDSPESLLDGFSKALETMKGNHKTLTDIFNKYKEECIKKSIDVTKNTNIIEVFI